MHPLPDFEQFASSVKEFGQMPRPDRSMSHFVEQTGGSLDPTRGDHSAALLQWLNAWGCRLDANKDGSETFSKSLSEWWHTCQDLIPPPSTAIFALSESQIEGAALAFEALSAASASARRSVAPTAAAKTLHVLRPGTLLAWDRQIAITMHGAANTATYGHHLAWGKAAGAHLLDSAQSRGLKSEQELSEYVQRPNVRLAKLLDEYLYTTITRMQV